MNTQIWGKNMQDAADGKKGVGFVEGTLQGPKEVTDEIANGVHHGLQWLHSPKTDPSHPVRITIYKLHSQQQATEIYNTKKAENGEWRDWPVGFPDRNNDYENVSCCGIQVEGMVGFAMWIQNYEASYLVVMAGRKHGEDAFEIGLGAGNTYPDGIYLAVHDSQLQEILT